MNKVSSLKFKALIEQEIKSQITKKTSRTIAQNQNKNLEALKEIDFSRFTDPSRLSNFLSSAGASTVGAIKELLAQSFLDYLGVSPKSWFYGMIVNAFGNLDFQDIADLIYSEDYDVCYNVTDAIMKAFLETGIDKVALSFGVPDNSLFARAIKEILSDAANDKASPIYQALAQTICDVDFKEVFSSAYKSSLGLPTSGIRDIALGAMDKEL